MARIIKRGDQRYLVRVYLGREDGHQQFYSKVVRGTLSDAKRFARDLESEQDLGVLVAGRSITLRQYLEHWLAHTAQSVSERTAHDYREYSERYIYPALGWQTLEKLSPLSIQSLYTSLGERGLSPRTVRYCHTILASALKQAVRWRLLRDNPAHHVDLPKLRRREMQALDAKQTRAFLKAAATDDWHAMWALAIDSGMRPEEYLGLRWCDVDLDKGCVSVQRVLIWRRRGGGWSLEEPKTPRSRRSIPIADSTIALLRKHHRRQCELRLAAGARWQSHDLVFTTRIGTPLRSPDLQVRHFKPTLERAKLPRSIRLYDLRHTMATLLLQAGVNPKIVAERLGHAGVSLALDTYSHVLPGMQEEATAKLSEVLSGG